MIIGLVGLTASGKDTVADYLKGKKDFEHISLSAILRKEGSRRGEDISPEKLMRFSVNFKKEKGADILAVLAKKAIKRNTVISSIRMPEEVMYLRQIPNFVLVEISGGSVEDRYERFAKREKEGPELIGYTKFLELEEEQKRGNGGQSLDKVVELKQETINNVKDSQFLFKQVDALLEKYND